MLEKFTDLWSEPADAKCITTNGFLKKNGEGVMGAGIAGEAQARYSHFPARLGSILQSTGNHVAILDKDLEYDGESGLDYETVYVAFPVKDVWYNDADPALIIRSAHELVELTDLYAWKKVLLPRPGCGNGRLKWDFVKVLIEPILDDRFIAIHNKFEG
jgi:hypothetical protein